jgi:DtxR family manganese transport transcriptional regulator
VAEDYVEAISDILANGDCRAVELVARFGVSAVTVNRTLGRLQRDGYIETHAYGPIQLTSKGRKLAKFAKARHQVVLGFLIALGISEETALIDSEGMEHHVSTETLEAMKRFLSNREAMCEP